MRSAARLTLGDDERSELERRASSDDLPKRMVLRARIVLLAAEGRSNREIGLRFGMHYNRVAEWRRRYREAGLAGLDDLERSGRRRRYGASERLELLRVVAGAGPTAGWTASGLAARMAARGISMSPSQARRICTALEVGPRFGGDVSAAARPVPFGCVVDLAGLCLGPAPNWVLLVASGGQSSAERHVRVLDVHAEDLAEAPGAHLLARAAESSYGDRAVPRRSLAADATPPPSLAALAADLLASLPAGMSLSCTSEWPEASELKALRGLEGDRFHLHLTGRRATFVHRLELLMTLLEEQGGETLEGRLAPLVGTTRTRRSFSWATPRRGAVAAAPKVATALRSAAPHRASRGRQPAPTLVVLAAGRAARFGAGSPLAQVGPDGATVLDFLASDALGAGFGDLVLVVHPDTAPLVRAHVRRSWPRWLPVAYAEQSGAGGTLDAVLAARGLLASDQPFAVASADGLYGVEALGLAAGALGGGKPNAARAPHAMVAFHLGSTLPPSGRADRRICEVDGNGLLRRLVERREVGYEGSSLVTSADGLEPALLAPDAITAVDLWAFQPSIWSHFAAAAAERDAREENPAPELHLPEVIARTLATQAAGVPVRVLVSTSGHLGVTCPADFALVRRVLARQLADGVRDRLAWKAGTPIKAVI